MSLKGLESDAGKVSSALNKMADSFSGRKIISDAELATKAVTEIGGATKLTESEQARLNAQLTVAIEKYKALGIQAPDTMVALKRETQAAADSIHKIPTETTSVIAGLGKLATAIGIGFSIGAVVSFGKSVFDSASKIHDMAEQLGISAEAVQGFKFAAEQAGSSLDAVGTALTKMNKNLAEGDKSTVNALKDAGLSFQAIRNLKPEDAFLAITDAIAKIPDPMKQVQVGTALMGRGFAELLPAIKEGFRDAADAADKMSNETVDRLEAAQDAWSKLGNKVTIITGEMIASVAKATSSFRDFADFLPKGLGLFGTGGTAPKDINLPAPPKPPPLVDPKTKEEIEEAEKAAKKYAEAVKALNAAITPLTEAQQKSVIAFDAQGASAEQIAAKLKISATAVSKFLADIQSKSKAQLDDYAEIVRQHQNDQRQGEAESLAAIEQLRQDELDASKSALDDYAEVVRHHQEEQRKGEEATLAALKKNASESAKVLGDLSQALSQLAQVSAGAFGSIVSGLSQIVGSARAAETAIKAMKTGLAKDENGKGKGFEGLLEISSGILGIVAAAIQAGQAIKSLFGLFNQHKGRDLVVDFADTFGGFDALHDKLLMLGADGEALWIKLTQGVGRNNPQQAQAAIDEVTKALDEQASKSDEAKGATEEQAQATIETANQAAKALEELGPKLEDSKAQWADWGSVVTAQLQTIADQIRQMPIPTPTGAVPFSVGGGTQKIQVNAPVYLDGQQITESVAYHTLN